MLEILLLAVASAAWPLLLAVVLIALGSAHPKRMLASFLAGGLLTTVVVGLVIVHLIRTSDFQIGSQDQSRAALPLALGAIALVGALVFARRARLPGAEKPESNAPGRLSRWLDRGWASAFLCGLVINVVPGAFPLLGLKDIAERNDGPAVTFALVTLFYLIMFAFLELPLAGFLVDPAGTATRTRRFNAWLGRNRTRLISRVLLIVGLYLMVRGLLVLRG